MICSRPSVLGVSLFVCMSTSAVFASSLQTGPSASGSINNSIQQAEASPSSDFSMDNVSIVEMRGGSYWMGFFVYTVDMEKGEVTAKWNRMDCSMKKAEGKAKLSPDDILHIKSAVESLQYEALVEGEPCFMMADGDESAIRLLQSEGDKNAPSYYPMKSWYTRCEGKPLTDDSYLAIEKAVFGILPEPEAKDAWTESNPSSSSSFGCSEVTGSR
jgi:hypothetical protein